VFADLHALHRGIDGRIRRAGNFFEITLPLWIPRVHLRRSAAEPDEDAMLGLAFRVNDFLALGGGERSRASQSGDGRRGSSGAQKFPARVII
jgi:hypothetical protein